MENTELKLHPSIKILHLKERLKATDYKAIKFAEGWLSEEEYAPIRAERQVLREQINEIEQELSANG